MQGYVNRYGPGMVIYWFGHVANLSGDRDVFITDRFPSDISLPGGYDPMLGAAKVGEGDRVPLELQTAETDFDVDWNPVTTCHL